MESHQPPEAEEYANTVLRRVDWSKELGPVRKLFLDYRAWLADHAGPSAGVPPGIRQLDALITELPGAYGPPGGDVILATRQSEIVACGALRGWEPGIAEIKRIYVRQDHRGPGFGPILTRALLDRARALGYDRVRVDTLPTMWAAIRFYQDLGFRPISAYWENPVPGALYFEWSAPRTGATSDP